MSHPPLVIVYFLGGLNEFSCCFLSPPRGFHLSYDVSAGSSKGSAGARRPTVGHCGGSPSCLRERKRRQGRPDHLWLFRTVRKRFLYSVKRNAVVVVAVAVVDVAVVDGSHPAT